MTAAYSDVFTNSEECRGYRSDQGRHTEPHRPRSTAAVIGEDVLVLRKVRGPFHCKGNLFVAEVGITFQWGGRYLPAPVIGVAGMMSSPNIHDSNSLLNRRGIAIPWCPVWRAKLHPKMEMFALIRGGVPLGRVPRSRGASTIYIVVQRVRPAEGVSAKAARTDRN